MNNMTQSEILAVYVKALNNIQDYFEYRYQSEQDKEYVYGVLLEMHKTFKEGFE